jgi:hypothetical protein
VGQVATVPTPSTPAKAIGAIIAALPSGAPRVAANIIAAQSAFETNTWGTGKSNPGHGFNGNNLGNITPSAAQVAAGIPWMTQGLNMKYIVYPNILAGAQGMVGWLAQHGVLPYAYSGDVAGYVGKLASMCYEGCIGSTDPTGHTVTQADYTALQNTINSRAASFGSVVPEFPSLLSRLTTLDLLLAATALAGLGASAYVLVTRP